MVYWVAFDLDGTLGSFESIMPLLILFFPSLVEELYRKPQWNGPEYETIATTPTMRSKLTRAFTKFVELMAANEEQTQLLRPGIVRVIQYLLDLQKKGHIGGMMIYSNNANPYALHFAHELIKGVLGVEKEIFCPLVHWGHRLRDEEIRSQTPPLLLGHGPKRVETIINAFTEWQRCGYYTAKTRHITITPADVIFIDDQIHPNISRALPPENYLHIQSYSHSPDVIYMYHALLLAYEGEDIDMNTKFTEQFRRVGFDMETADTLEASIRERRYVVSESPVTDEDVILRRFEDLFPVKKGGRRATSRKRTKRKTQ